jgi:hypothetical protein
MIKKRYENWPEWLKWPHSPFNGKAPMFVSLWRVIIIIPSLLVLALFCFFVFLNDGWSEAESVWDKYF